MGREKQVVIRGERLVGKEALPMRPVVGEHKYPPDLDPMPVMGEIRIILVVQ